MDYCPPPLPEPWSFDAAMAWNETVKRELEQLRREHYEQVLAMWRAGDETTICRDLRAKEHLMFREFDVSVARAYAKLRQVQDWLVTAIRLSPPPPLILTETEADKLLQKQP